MNPLRASVQITWRGNFFTNYHFFLLPISSNYAKILVEKLFHTWEIPRSGSKAEDGEKRRKNTPGTAGGPGGRDRTLAVKAEKTSEKSPFFL